LELNDDLVEDWFACRVETEWGFPNPGYCPNPSVPSNLVPGIGLQRANTVLISSLGIFFFLMFGTDKNIYIAWYYFFYRCWWVMFHKKGLSHERRLHTPVFNVGLSDSTQPMTNLEIMSDDSITIN